MYVAVTLNAMLENWASLVRKLLCSIGCNEVWLQQGVSNRHSFLRQCKRDIYIQNWSELINLKSSCLLYKNVHVDFKLSKYLILVNVKKHRLALTKFRLKKHKLPNIVKGRGRARLPYNERLYDTCDTLGDEYHCIFECIKTEHIRHILPDLGEGIDRVVSATASHGGLLSRFISCSLYSSDFKEPKCFFSVHTLIFVIM